MVAAVTVSVPVYRSDAAARVKPAANGASIGTLMPTSSTTLKLPSGCRFHTDA